MKNGRKSERWLGDRYWGFEEELVKHYLNRESNKTTADVFWALISFAEKNGNNE